MTPIEHNEWTFHNRPLPINAIRIDRNYIKYAVAAVKPLYPLMEDFIFYFTSYFFFF